MFKTKLQKTALGATALLASGAVMAEQSAGISAATGAFGSLITDAGSIIDAAWPLLVAVVGAGIVMKLAKRFMAKAS